MKGLTAIRAIGLVCVVLLVAATGAGGEPARAQSGVAASRVPTPIVPRGEGERCVADVDVMRRNHMKMLKHQRDVTVHQGDRASAAKLTACIACHAVRGADGKPVSYAEPQHFCRSCHAYAAVSVDCFECHASRPEAKPATAAAEPDVSALAHYLRSQKP